MTPFTDYTISPMPKPIGYWRVGALTLFAVYGRKPNWFHRIMTHLMFGWVWRDE